MQNMHDYLYDYDICYDITWKRIDRDRFECNIGYDRSKPAKAVYKSFTGSMAYRVSIDSESVLTLEQFKAFLENLAGYNENNAIRDQNERIKSKMIYALENTYENEESSFRICISKYYIRGPIIMKAVESVEFAFDPAAKTEEPQERIEVNEPIKEHAAVAAGKDTDEDPVDGMKMAELGALQWENEDLKERVGSLEEEVEKLKGGKLKLTGENEELKTEIKGLKDAESELNALKGENEDLRKCIGNLEEEIKKRHEEKSELAGENERLRGEIEKIKKDLKDLKDLRDMLDSVKFLYENGAVTNQRALKQLKDIKKHINETESTNEEIIANFEKVLQTVGVKVETLHAMKKWEKLKTLKATLEDVTGRLGANTRNSEPSEVVNTFFLIAAEKLERILAENQIDWEAEAQFLMPMVNNRNHRDSSDDLDQRLKTFLESIALKQIYPEKGANFNSKEHDVDKVISAPGLARGRIVNTVKRGLKRSDDGRVLQRALVNIAQ